MRARGLRGASLAIARLPKQRVRELWAVAGRRSGKTRIAAAISVYTATIAQHKLAPGEVGYVLLLAASRSQASIAFSYVCGFLEASPILRQQVESMTADEVRLKGNVVIGVHAGSYRTIRGRSLLAVVGDETSFWRDIDSAQPDVEILSRVHARACCQQRPLGRNLYRIQKARPVVPEVARLLRPGRRRCAGRARC